MKKLPPSALKFMFPLVLSMMMSGIISLVNMLRIIGFHDGLMVRWLMAWALSWMIAFPTVFVIMPIARKIVGLFVQMPADTKG